MSSFKVRMRSIIALVATSGVIAIALVKPEHASEALATLSVALGSYFGNLPQRKGNKEDDSV